MSFFFLIFFFSSLALEIIARQWALYVGIHVGMLRGGENREMGAHNVECSDAMRYGRDTDGEQMRRNRREMKTSMRWLQLHTYFYLRIFFCKIDKFGWASRSGIVWNTTRVMCDLSLFFFFPLEIIASQWALYVGIHVSPHRNVAEQRKEGNGGTQWK